jgi:MFS family permease
MVALFLRTELGSVRHQARVHELLDREDLPSRLLTSADLTSPGENAQRRELLSAHRGYAAGEGLFAGFPQDVRWDWMAFQPIALLVLLLAPGLAGVIAFVVVFGAAKGCLTLVRPAFVAELYGRAHYASIAGALAFAVTLAQAATPVGAGAAYDALGGYTPILWALVAVSAVASLALVPTRREPRSSTVQRAGPVPPRP